jgi:hypothetical protein
MLRRYAIRPDRGGFSVFDIWTGEVAVVAMVPLNQLSRRDAEKGAELLNRRSERGDRTVLQ